MEGVVVANDASQLSDAEACGALEGFGEVRATITRGRREVLGGLHEAAQFRDQASTRPPRRRRVARTFILGVPCVRSVKGILIR